MAAGILLVIAGVWVVLQTNVGDLPGRIVSYRGASLSPAESKAVDKVIDQEAKPVTDLFPDLLPDVPWVDDVPWVPGI